MKQHVDEVAAAGSPPAAASSSKQGKGKRSKKRRKKRGPKASSKKKSKAKSSKTAARQPPATTAPAPAASPPPAAPASPQTLEPPQPPVELRDEGVDEQSPPAPPHSASPAADDTASVASAGTPSPSTTDDVGGEADAVPPSDGGAAPGEAQVQSDGSTSIISSSGTIDANDVDATVAVQDEGDVAGSPQHVLFVSLALRSHATPLLRLAREMVRRGYRVTFAINDEGRHWVNATGASFLSTGPLPGGDLTAQLAAVAKVFVPFAVPHSSLLTKHTGGMYTTTTTTHAGLVNAAWHSCACEPAVPACRSAARCCGAPASLCGTRPPRAGGC